ncbi:MAG: glucosamine-6-phosphate deaminase [Spirochaetales bacterium]|nr:glucosamine-6-phosphate deaminase [Spirochaetales bacterium]
MMIKKINEMKIHILRDRDALGRKAAADIEATIKKLLQYKQEIIIIFAAAPSQNEMFEYLVQSESIEWNRIAAYHMDEYLGLPDNAVQLFSRYLKHRLFDLLSFKEVNLINGNNDPERECKRYGGLIDNNQIDMVCMGIGENGHIAFNDPTAADFNDGEIIKKVKLDPACRQQQVNDGCFDTIDDVPEYALTLTIPVLLKASHIFCVVPGKTKQSAVYNALNGEINIACPASILRSHKNCRLYLDKDSSELLWQK